MALSFFAEFTIRYNDKMSEELQICLKEGREERQANRTHRKEQRKAKKEARRVEKKVAKHYELEEVVCVAPRIYSNLTSPKAYDQKFGFAIYDGDGGLRTTSSNTTTDKVLERSTMYTQKENDVVSTKREYQATLKRDDVGPVVSRTERVKKSYEYGNKKGVDTNTVLEVVKTLVQGYFGSKK